MERGNINAQTLVDSFNDYFQKSIEKLSDGLVGPPIDEEKVAELVKTILQLLGVVSVCCSSGIRFDEKSGKAKIN